MAASFNGELRNIARGGLSYRKVRHRIFLAMQRSGLSGSYELSDFLRSRLLGLRKGEWVALAFDEKDWRALDVIRLDRSERWLQVYLPLVLDYVSANADRVRRMIDHSNAIGVAMLKDDGLEAQRVLSSLDAEDEQSLFAFRSQSVQYSFDADRVTSLLRSKLKTEWLRKRYLYPLVFQAVAAPPPDGLDEIVSYVVSEDGASSEREALRFILRDDGMYAYSLAFKAYVALLCHPYDAYELLLNHFEIEICNRGAHQSRATDIISRLHDVAPSSRTAYLLDLIKGNLLRFSECTNSNLLQTVYGLDEKLAGFVAQLTSSASDVEIGDETPKPLAALARMRTMRYPLREDFDYIVSSARSWWFCEGGRLLGSLLTSLYMLARGEPNLEIRDMLRLAGFLGGVTPFVMTSPSASALRNEASAPLLFEPFARLEAATEPHIKEPGSYADRMWIKAAHWNLRKPKRQFQIGQWLDLVRRDVRVAPAYLTGIDWAWLDVVIRKVRLSPFIGEPAGLYALLLMKIEQRERRSGALRTAIEPIVVERSLPDLVDWLISEYGQEAIAFARFLLEVDDLLWLGLAPNRTAALAGRIYALERCIRQFGYTDLLPENLFKQEWEMLNSTLLLLSVNAGQFEVPWSTFIRDVASKQHDLYTAAHSLEPSDATAAALASSRVNFLYKFRNERVETYTYPHRLAPIIALILAVVEDFLAHPAFGLEMILSTRFRHDTMRREFAAVFEEVAGMPIGATWIGGQREIIEEAEKTILAPLDDWLEERMQTARPGKPKALFDVIPSSAEMVHLAEALDISKGVDSVIGEIVGWVRGRLEHQLPAAKAVYEAEVPTLLRDSTFSERSRLADARNLPTTTVERVMGVLYTSLDRRARELTEWFKGEPEEARPPLTLAEIKAAADGLFEAYRERRGYRTYVTSASSLDVPVPAERVRPVFDLLREVFAAALAHSEPHLARIRIRPWACDGMNGFMFSNMAKLDVHASRAEVRGDPYESLNDVIFREGDSGLPKIAALAATVVGSSVEVVAERRPRSFHLLVPFSCTSSI